MKSNPILPLLFAAASLAAVSSCKSTGYSYDASGTFEAVSVIVSAESSGKIVSLPVREGNLIEKGKEYGLIDTIQLSLQKKQLEAAAEAARCRVQDVRTYTAQIEEQIRINRKEKVRIENLIRANAANTKQLDDINSAISLLEKQLSSAKAQISQNNSAAQAEAASIEVQIEQVRDQLSRCRITSPIDGTVLVKYAEEGELTGAGKPIFKVADIQNMNLRAYITSTQLNELKLGQEVTLYADSGKSGSREYKGKVTWISDQSEFTPKTIQTRDERTNLVYAIKISFINDGYVKIGMYGDVKF